MNDQVRRATTEALFRDVNERIAESAEQTEMEQTDFVCECADPDCTERVPATLDEYEKVRAAGSTFLVAPGHEHPDIERVVSDRGRFRIVDKVQSLVRRTVLRLDPRRRPAAPSES